MSRTAEELIPASVDLARLGGVLTIKLWRNGAAPEDQGSLSDRYSLTDQEIVELHRLVTVTYAAHVLAAQTRITAAKAAIPVRDKAGAGDQALTTREVRAIVSAHPGGTQDHEVYARLKDTYGTRVYRVRGLGWHLAPAPTFFECGICGMLHPSGHVRDCRADSSRFHPEDLDTKYGPTGWNEVEYTDE
jgi:hypothetical protein